MISVSGLKPGVELGRYRLVRELGRGAMGLVFLAEDKVLREKLCVKVLHPGLQMNTEAVERFHREIVLARRISHRGVCRLHDLHREQDVLFFTMEHVEGTSLRDVLINRSPLPLSEVVSIVRSICDALAAAHDVSVIHRDLKPRNIIVRDGGEVSLLDFGIATALDFVSSLTVPGVALGTNSYISPEVWAGRPATARSDQYAVGVIFYNCLTNKMPFPSGGQPIPLEKIRDGALPPSTHRKGMPAAFDAIVLRALSYDPAARFADVRALSRAIADVLLIDEQTLPLASIPTVSAPIDADTRAAAPRVSSDATQPLPAEANDGWQVATVPSMPRPAQEKAAQEKAAQEKSAREQAAEETVARETVARETTAREKDAHDKADITHEDDKTSPAFSAVRSQSASWVVAGKPVDLPAIPKVIEGARAADESVPTGTLPELAQPRAKSRAPLAIGALLAIGIVAAVAMMAVRSDDNDNDNDNDNDIKSALVAAVPPVAPVVVAPVVVAPIGPAPDVAPRIVDVVAPPPVATQVGVARADVPRVRKNGRDAEERTDRNNDRNNRGDRSAYTQASSALAKELGARGLRSGDDAELDRARATASSMASAQRWRDASTAIDEARARAREVSVDRAFIEKKLRRFNDAFDRVADEGQRTRLDVNATRALTEMTSGRFEAANRALNEGFMLMEKRR